MADGSYNLREILEQIELELVQNMRRNMKRHSKEEEKEGFKWEMWQKSKLRNLWKYRKENQKIVESHSEEIEKIIKETLHEEFEKAENLFNKIARKVKKLFSAPKDISHHKLSTPAPKEENFFGMNENKIDALQSEAEKVVNQKPNTSVQKEPDKQPEKKKEQDAPDQKPDAPAQKEPDKKDEPAPQEEPFKPEGKEKELTGSTQDKKLEDMTNQVTHDLKEAQRAIWRRMDDVYRQVVYRAEMHMAAGAKTLDQAIDMATKEFLEKGIDCIEYKNGRRVNIASYAEMCLRTASQRATLLGEGKKRDEWGIHTVVVTAHANTCPLCAPWQGKVLIDDVFSHGTSEEAEKLGYPLLSTAMKAGLLHPNCRHTISTYFPGITKTPNIPDTEKALETYKAEQEQRAIEREIKKWKRKAEGACEPDNVAFANRKRKIAQDKLKIHLDKHPELRREPSREKTRGVPDKPKSTKETGGKYKRGSAEWNLRRDDEAEAFYDEMRRINADVKAIAKNTGWTEHSIAQIKNHIFNNKHILDGGTQRFDADYDMAVAWKRLMAGTPSERDILLLKHEYLESVVEKKYNLTYREAHERATIKHDWNEALRKELGEYGEADNLYEIN